jgi:hypothetical protein
MLVAEPGNVQSPEIFSGLFYMPITFFQTKKSPLVKAG